MTLEKIKTKASEAAEYLWQAAGGLGRDPKIYLHWTGGRYEQDFGDYHLSIHGDGTVVQTASLYTVVEGTYRRNTGSIAIALDCCLDAAPDDMGAYPPTEAQIECMAQVVAVLAGALGIPIDIQHVMTHAEAADNMDGYHACDPYGPANGCERWDLAILAPGDEWMSGGDTLRGKAIWYQQQGV